MANVFFFLDLKCMANVFFLDLKCMANEFFFSFFLFLQSAMLEATTVKNRKTPLTAILGKFWPAQPTRLPMFLIPKLLDAYHAAPRWKGLE